LLNVMFWMLPMSSLTSMVAVPSERARDAVTRSQEDSYSPGKRVTKKERAALEEEEGLSA